MTVLHPWALDWSISAGVALATRDSGGAIRTVCLAPPTRGSQLASRLWTHREITVTAARDALALYGWPLAVYVEQPTGQPNPSLSAAYGVTLEALWDVLRGAPFETSIWPLTPGTWRKMLGLSAPKEASKTERRQQRKDQQKQHALAAGAAVGLTEDEYDAACMLLAGEREIRPEAVAA